MKNKKVLMLTEILFVFCSLILIALISIFNEDEWTGFIDRFLMYGFAYIPILIVGLCTIHIVISHFLDKAKYNAFSWGIVILAFLYCIYIPIAIFAIGHITTMWYVIPILILGLWIINMCIVILKKYKEH